MSRHPLWVLVALVALTSGGLMLVGTGTGAPRVGGHTYVLASGDRVSIPSIHLTCVYSQDASSHPFMCRGRPGSLCVEITDVFIHVWTFDHTGSTLRVLASCLREPAFPKQKRHPCTYAG